MNRFFVLVLVGLFFLFSELSNPVFAATKNHPDFDLNAQLGTTVGKVNLELNLIDIFQENAGFQTPKLTIKRLGGDEKVIYGPTDLVDLIDNKFSVAELPLRSLDYLVEVSGVDAFGKSQVFKRQVGYYREKFNGFVANKGNSAWNVEKGQKGHVNAKRQKLFFSQASGKVNDLTKVSVFLGSRGEDRLKGINFSFPFEFRTTVSSFKVGRGDSARAYLILNFDSSEKETGIVLSQKNEKMNVLSSIGKKNVAVDVSKTKLEKGDAQLLFRSNGKKLTPYYNGKKLMETDIPYDYINNISLGISNKGPNFPSVSAVFQGIEAVWVK